MFFLAVFLYDEPLSVEKLTTFVLIWSALAMLIVDSIRRIRKTKAANFTAKKETL
jgi:chloramphenicol-sensitive protein RarD